MNIITDVNNLTKTVGDSIKEFFTSVVVNIGTPVANGVHNRQVRIYEKQHARRPDDIISGAAERLVFRFWRTEF